MARKRTGDVIEAAEQLLALERQFGTGRAVLRLRTLRLLAERSDRGLEDVAAELGVSSRTVKRWWALYRERGLAGLVGEEAGRIVAERTTTVGAAEHGAGNDGRGIPGALRGLEQGRATAGDYISLRADRIAAFVGALSSSTDVSEWSRAFRVALMNLLGDVDHVSISINLLCGLDPESYHPSALITQSLATGATVVDNVDADAGFDENAQRFIRYLNGRRFAANEYHPPLYRVASVDGRAYLGTIVLWRARGRSPISQLSVDIIDAMQGVLTLAMWNFVLRHQMARPAEHAGARMLDAIVSDAGLTLQERRVLTLLMLGYSQERVALSLNVSINTVRHHLRSLYRKTGAHGRSDLFAKYFSLRIGPRTDKELL